jgi:hypothetical protein
MAWSDAARRAALEARRLRHSNLLRAKGGAGIAYLSRKQMADRLREMRGAATKHLRGKSALKRNAYATKLALGKHPGSMGRRYQTWAKDRPWKGGIIVERGK